MTESNHPPVTMAFLSALAASFPGDPAVDDFGALFTAEMRPLATAVGEPVYRGPRAQAAAVFHQLVRVPALEHGNARLAAAAADTILRRAELPVNVTDREWAALAREAWEGKATVHSIAEAFRRWTT